MWFNTSSGSVPNPLPVTTPLATPINGQIIIAVTNTAVQLPSNSLVNGITVKAKTTNIANGFLGGSTVNTTDTGSGNGYRLLPGEAVAYATSNSNLVYVNGTAGDIYYYNGN